MIPSFDEFGNLPPGIHRATLTEIEARFGQQSETRRVQMESIRWMVDLAARAGILRIILNGSFVTYIIEPNDVDCVLLAGRGFPKDPIAEAELDAGLPFLDISIARKKEFERLANEFFAVDRFKERKRTVELIS